MKVVKSSNKLTDNALYYYGENYYNKLSSYDEVQKKAVIISFLVD